MSSSQPPISNARLRVRRSRVLRRRRAGVSHRRRWAALALLVVLAGLVAGYLVLTDRNRLRRMTQAYLQQFFASDVRVGEVSFSLLEGIQLARVDVAEMGARAAMPPLLSFETMQLRHDPLALLLGRIEVDEVVATRPMIRARFDAATGRFNVQEVLRVPTSQGRKAPPALPELRIQDAHLFMYADTNSDSTPVEDVAFSITGKPGTAEGRRYDVAWMAQTDRASRGQLAVDLRRGTVEDVQGGAPWLALQAASLAVEATEPRAKRWIDLLGITGRFRIMDYAIAVRRNRSAHNRLAIEFDGGRLSLPVDRAEESLPPEDRYLRLEDVSGRVSVDADGATAELSGNLGGAPCTLRGRLNADVSRAIHFADVGFEVDVAVHDWPLPRPGPDAPAREARFIDRWERLRRFYAEFSPSGVVDVEATLAKKPGADAGVELVRALVRAHGAAMSYWGFPYKITDVAGELEMTAEGVFLNGLTGRHGPGEITATGWMQALRRTSHAELYFSGRGISLDDDLCAAIAGRHHQTWERFSPEGFADIEVAMQRPAGDGAPTPWTVTIDADLLGVDARFDAFPYPLRDLRGRVRIAGDEFRVDNVRGRCGAGGLTADGFVRTVPGGAGAVDLHLHADAVRLDDMLLAALPEQSRKEVTGLDAGGLAEVDVHLGSDDGGVTYDIALGLSDVHVCPQAFPLAVERMSGEVRVGPDEVELASVSGQASGGTVQVSGRIGRTADADSALAVRGERIQFSDALRAALPEKIRAQLAPWRIDGPFDLEGRLSSDGEHRMRLELDGATVTYAPFPLAWRVLSGDVVIEQEKVWLRRVRAVCGKAELFCSGAIDRTGGDVQFAVHGLELNDTMREALPWRWRRRWNDAQPRGTVDMLDGRLNWGQAVGQSDAGVSPAREFSGNLVLHDVGLGAGVSISGVNGRMELSGEMPKDSGNLFLRGDLRLDHLTAGNYQIDDLTGRMLRDGEGGRVRFDGLRGKIHGGQITGELDFDTVEGAADYSLSVLVQRASVQGLVNARRARQKDRPPVEMTGYVDGRFFLTGTAGDAASQRGGGRVQVRDAELYRLPLLLAVLQVINLSLPEQSAFQSAGAGLTLVGDELRFTDVELVGGALALVGEGTMQVSSSALDMRLITVSPHRWAEMPVLTEMLEGVSRELVQVEVTGTLSEPVATAQPLRNMEAVLEALLTLRSVREDDRPTITPGP